ncbi:RHS repeat-associated core domain-containing protein, partial [Psychroserpens sp.]
APMIGDLSIYSSGATVNDFFIVDLEKELQEVDYTYNIRGWLKSINDIEDLGVVGGANSDLFAFKINYNTHELGGTPLYNGNISETLWNTLSVNPNTQEYKRKRGYDYTYDALNRIKDADFHKLSGVERDNYYNLSNISYDRNGNIITLARSGVDNSGSLIEDMDDLTYAYDGNQLYDISEAGNHSYGFKDFENNQNLDYTYDANGNMTYDYNKEILISYNHLNLPTSVVKSSQELITYIYDATGVKQSKSVTEDTNTTITDYANNFIYKDSKLEFFSHPEGYTEYDGKNYDYIYQYKDHLGNIRLSYSDINNNGKIETSSEIIEENNYYPFGLKHKGYNNVINGTDHPYGFGGMEEQDELGLGWIDITARNYDPALGRWMNLDLMSEAQYSFSPYHYAYNSPIAYSDPTGMIGESDTTTVVNGDDPTQTFVVDDGYDFEFVVDSDVFNKIKETGSIKGTGAYYRWFFEAVGHEVKKTDGSATDEVASFVLYDTVGDVIIALSEKDIGKGVLNIAAGKLKKLKKFARWLKKNKGKKIPGTKQGGGQFKNKEGNLPKTDANGKEVTYQKYDVNPAPQHGATRGTERMVTGTDGKVYYTNDHYKTFTEIKPDGN